MNITITNPTELAVIKRIKFIELDETINAALVKCFSCLSNSLYYTKKCMEDANEFIEIVNRNEQAGIGDAIRDGALAYREFRKAGQALKYALASQDETFMLKIRLYVHYVMYMNAQVLQWYKNYGDFIPYSYRNWLKTYSSPEVYENWLNSKR